MIVICIGEVLYPVRPFHPTYLGTDFVNEICIHNMSHVFLSYGADVFLAYKITQTKSSESRTKILKMFSNVERILQRDRGERMKQFKHGNLVSQKQNINCMRFVIFYTASKASYSTASTFSNSRWSSWPGVNAATSNSNAELGYTGGFRLRTRTSHSASGSLMQYSESWTLQRPKKRTRKSACLRVFQSDTHAEKCTTFTRQNSSWGGCWWFRICGSSKEGWWVIGPSPGHQKLPTRIREPQ